MTVLPQDIFDATLLRLVNEARAEERLNPLKMSAPLDAAADLQSRQMAQQDFFSHRNPRTGSTMESRVQATGYLNGANGGGYGENIAAGQPTPEAVMNSWMNSEGHRRNILNPNYTHIGIGYFYLPNDTGSVNYRHYWTQVFGYGGVEGNYQAETDSQPSAQPSSANLMEGTSAGDLLLGTAMGDTLKGFDGEDTLKGAGGNDRLFGGRGRDRLIAGGGNDKVIGGEQNDTLRGGSGNDQLIGVNPSASNSIVGKGEKDTLIGNHGADTYVLGQNGKVFYDDRKLPSPGTKDYGLIVGLNQNSGDRIQLEGRPTDYILGQSGRGLPRGTKIYFKQSGGADELIGVVKNVTINSLTTGAFRFV